MMSGVTLDKALFLVCVWSVFSLCCTKEPSDLYEQRTVEVSKEKENKRAPALSINQPLMSLASSIRGRHRHGAGNTLALLGKRPAMSFTNDLNALAGLVRHGQTAAAQSKLGLLGKRNPSDWATGEHVEESKRLVSVNQPLVALADMVNAGRAGSTMSRLHGLGKRAPALSVNQPLVALSNMMAGGKTTSSFNRLQGLGKKRSQAEVADADNMISSEKRPALSVNQALVSLADNLHGYGGHGASHARLLSLGKRPSESANPEQGEPKTTLYDVQGTEEDALEDANSIHEVYRREAGSDRGLNKEWDFADQSLYTDGEDESVSAAKRPAMSINQDLMTLADMIRSRNAGPGTSRLLTLGKRPAMSINNDLMTLANMMNGFRSAGSRSRLISLGKRPEMSINADLMAIADSLRSRHNLGSTRLNRLGKRASDAAGEDTDGGMFRKRRGAVSISVPLETISEMVSAERRRQYKTRASNSISRLHGIGKRSAEVDQSAFSNQDSA